LLVNADLGIAQGLASMQGSQQLMSSVPGSISTWALVSEPGFSDFQFF